MWQLRRQTFSHVHFTLHMSNTSFEEEFQLKGKKKENKKRLEKERQN